MAKRANLKGAGEGIPVEDLQFWESELGQYIAAEADENVAIEDVRQALSAISGSLAGEIRRKRDIVSRQVQFTNNLCRSCHRSL